MFSLKSVSLTLSCVLFFAFHTPVRLLSLGRTYTASEILNYRSRVEKMFYHAYDNYVEKAFPYDELRPLSCDGVDTWGSFSLTLIDALDTLAVMGNYSEFCKVSNLLVNNIDFDININVSVFETNIRVVGGLLSAHLMTHRAGCELEEGWPCAGPLLTLAENVARRLLPAFATETGMPYGTVNLAHGVPVGETSITCTAGVATFLLEFGTLSRLSGDEVFERTALQALHSLWHARSSIDLVGNHIDVQSGKWTAVDSGIGAGVDSYLEYLVKGAILLHEPKLMTMFDAYRASIKKHMEHDDWYMWVNMAKGQVTLPVFQSLEAYWPGLLTLVGEIESALKTLYNYHQVWKQFGFTPEFYNIPNAEPNTNREGYPLRPELIESIMYVYRATKDPQLIQMGVDILESIEFSSRTPCGYATVKDVRSHTIEDRMESFFLAETSKYLFLLFDHDNFLHADGSEGTLIQTPHGECVIQAGGYVFNTEAHPIDVSALHCCSEMKQVALELQHFHDNLNLLSLLSLDEQQHFLSPLNRKTDVQPEDQTPFPEESEPEVEKDDDTPDVEKDDETETEKDDEAEVERNDEAEVEKEEEEEAEVEKEEDETPEAEVVGVGSVMELGEVSEEEGESTSGPLFLENRSVRSGSSESLFRTETKLSLDSPKFNRAELGSSRNASNLRRKLVMERDYSVLRCPAQPFNIRFSVFGEMFGND